MVIENVRSGKLKMIAQCGATRSSSVPDVPTMIDFMVISSYGTGTQSSGVVRILKDLDQNIAERDVLVVEDIVDSGLTLSYLMRTLRAHQVREIGRAHV